VTTISFWNRSVLVTDRSWRIDAHPRGGHPFVDGRTRRSTALSLVLRKRFLGRSWVTSRCSQTL
jgi:hypothetical protein